jgi:enolase-phosphatase E1
MTVSYILSDIEGTTTSITFVHDVLFPYSREKLEAFVQSHREDPSVRNALEHVKTTALEEKHNPRDLEPIQILKTWIDSDRKHPALKFLQGLIWEEGYHSKKIIGHVYEDVPPAFERWRKQGLSIGIYSSGSVLAQRLLFGYTPFGDLNRFISDNFDTAVGPKREPASYLEICRRLKRSAKDILFLSDTPEELLAAQKSGMQVIRLMRENDGAVGAFQTAFDFKKIIP